MTVPAEGTTDFALTAPGVAVDLLVVRPAGTPVSGAIAQSSASNYTPGSLPLFPGDTQGYGSMSRSDDRRHRPRQPDRLPDHRLDAATR